MIQLYILMMAAVPLFAQTPTSYPRTVLTCEMTEGGAELTEERPGVYSYKGSYGYDGVNAGGKAKIDLTKDLEKCTLKISAGDGARKLSRSFSWTVVPSGIPKSVSEASLQDGVCRIRQRYSKSFSQCTLPTPTEPGTQCHGEGGKDLTASLPSGSPVINRKLVGYSGGMTIEVDPESQRGITVWRNTKEEKSWCYELKTLYPDRCKKLVARQEIRNSKGQIIGILEPQAEQVLFKQTKQPYSENGYEIDSSALSVRLTNSKTETNVIALGKNGAEAGRLTILGNIDLPTRLRSFNRPAVNILNGSAITSDCNGVVNGSNHKGATKEKSKSEF